MTALLAGLLLAAVGGSAPRSEGALPLEMTARWALAADGRVRPLLAVALDTVRRLEGTPWPEEAHALEVFWTLALDPERALRLPLIELPSPELRVELDLPPGGERATLAELLASQPLGERVRQAQQARAEGRPLPARLAVVGQLQRRLDAASERLGEKGLRLVPFAAPDGGWLPPSALQGDPRAERQRLYHAFVRLRSAFRNDDGVLFGEAAETLGETLRAFDPRLHPRTVLLERELLLLDFHPAGKALVGYLLAIVLLGASRLAGRPRIVQASARLILLAALVLHLAAIALRGHVAGRVPLGSAYEQLLAAVASAVVLGLVLDRDPRGGTFHLLAALAGGGGLLLLQVLALDPSIGPLPVALAGTSWLVVHGLPAAGGVGACGLAGLGATLLLFRQALGPALAGTTTHDGLERLLRVSFFLQVVAFASALLWADAARGRAWTGSAGESATLLLLLSTLGLRRALGTGLREVACLAGCALLLPGTVIAWTLAHGDSTSSLAGTLLPAAGLLLVLGTLAGVASTRRRRVQEPRTYG